MKPILFISLFTLSLSGDLQSQTASVYYFKFSSQEQSVSMAYAYQKAEKSNGKTVLLLHGKNFSHSYWQQTMNVLNQKGYDVIAPDQVGFGLSSKTVAYQYSFQQLAVNTKKLLDTLRISNVIVVAHSMGGMIATRFALMYPGTCERLILENPIGLEDWKTMVHYSTMDEEYAKEKKKTKEQLKDYFIKNYFHGEWKAMYDPVLDETAALSKKPDSLAYAKCMALTSDMIFTQPVCYEFRDIKVPAVLIIGQADRTAIGKEKADENTAAKMGNYPELGRKTATQIPGSKLIELKGLGHIPHLEDFAAFIKALEEAFNK
jgi:pimeloyl-ACP methyl ester carboxylesterase